MGYDFDRVIDRSGTGSEKWMPFEGGDVLPMPVADMDFRSPPKLLEALREKVDHGVFGYAQPTASLVEAIVSTFRERYRWKIRPEWIVWLPGLVSGLNVTCRAVGEPGDAVLTMTPVYPPFLTSPGNMKRDLQTVPMLEKGDEWEIDWEGLERARTEKTKLFLLCQPHNPMGKVFSTEDLTRLAEFCREHNIVLCSDEIHCDLILDDRPHQPTASLSEDIADNTITLMAPSKTYNVAGLGCAFAVIPNRELRLKFEKAKIGIVPQVTVFGYAACEAAYKHGESWRQELLAYLRGNLALVQDFIRSEVPLLRTYKQEATYLSWIDARELALRDPAAFFQERGLALSNGAFFQGPGFVRLNFGCPRKTLEEGLDRLKKAVDHR